MTATLRSNIHTRFLAPVHLDVNDYFKKTSAQDWKLKHYLNYRLESENITPTWSTVYNDWVDSLKIIIKNKKSPGSIVSFCKELINFSTFEGESVLVHGEEWYRNFYNRYCDLQLSERVKHIEEKIYSSIKLSDLLENTTSKKRPQEDNYVNEAGPSNEKRSRHEDLSCESTSGTCLESYQLEQDELRILAIETEEPSIEWEFSAPKPNWLDKIAQEQQLLTSALFSNDDTKIRYELSLNPILWKIIDLFDQRITNLLSESELSELNTTISASLKNWTILEPMAERYLYSLAKLDGNQLRIIGEIVRPKGTHGAILELQKILNNIKETPPEESDDDLFEDKDTFENDDKNFHEEIPLSTEDHTNADVAFIFDLIRFTCEMIAKGIPQRQNSERDIDMFIKRHIFSCFDTILDSHFGEVVSRASRNRRAVAIDAPSNTEGYHLDWMFTKHDLGKELYWGREFSLCERTGSKCEDTSKVLSNTLKVQKTLRDMHRNLVESISDENGGMLSMPVLHASTKLLMPGFLSSYFFLRAMLIVYIGGGFYISANLADLYIPTKYEELESILKISRVMLQIKKLLSITISRFKSIKNRAEKEKFAPGKVIIPARQQEHRSPQKKKVNDKIYS